MAKVEQLIDDSIAEKRAWTNFLQREIEELEKQRVGLKEKTGIEKWLGHKFKSSYTTTKEFASFAREYKRELVKQLPSGCEVVRWSRGHFGFSCFIRKGNKYVYMSISDVRFSPDAWYENILIRTAKNDKDYTGGSNNYSDWKNLRRSIEALFK